MINTKINLVNKKIDELIPYENNPRHNDGAVNPVAESISEHGYKVPIIIDGNNVIVTGHTRLKALKQLGVESVDVIVADDLTEEQVKAFRLIDNKTSELSEWDFMLLEEEMAGLDIDLSVFGFDHVESIDWAEVEDLSEKTYKEPETKKLRCPHCNFVDYAIHFVSVNKDT